MRKRIVAVLAAFLTFASAMNVPILAAEGDSALNTVKALGIITGDTANGMNLDGNVTRAQFAKMLAAASEYKDTISDEGTGYSVFKDVKSTHWASEYIKLAIDEGWMTGYSDGSFKPDKQVTLEEACSSALKLLGYDTSSFAGTFPNAQLNKAKSLGIRDNIYKTKGQILTREDCVYLFYNLLTAKTSGGQTYASTIGYAVTNGYVDYTDVAVNNLSGPYVAGAKTDLPFVPEAAYYNGSLLDYSGIDEYDVYYYNEAMGTVWIYTEKASGRITAVSPDSTSPDSVTVNGVTYSVGSGDASYKLSVLGGTNTGDFVTLLLGMDNKVVDVINSAAGGNINATYYGVVTSAEKTVYDNNLAQVEMQVTVICTDGITRTFATSDTTTTFSSGSIVYVNVNNSDVTIRYAEKSSISGKINNTATQIGNTDFANNIKILDVAENGTAIAVEPSRLAGETLSGADVLYYALDENHDVETMILNDVTGDAWTYGYITDMVENTKEMSDGKGGTSYYTTYSYTFVSNGTVKNFESSNAYTSGIGAVAILFNNDGSVNKVKKLTETSTMTTLGAEYSMAGSYKYEMHDEVQVYLRKSGEYYLTSLSAVNTTDYNLTGYYDNFGCKAGGRIRVILASAK